MASKRTLRRVSSKDKPFSNLSPLQQKLRTHEKNFIEKFTGKSYATLTEARKALAQRVTEIQRQLPSKLPQRSIYTQAVHIQENKIAPIAKPEREYLSEFNPRNTSRKDKAAYARKIGREKYQRMIEDWFEDYPDMDRDDNPFFYHERK